MKKYAVEDNILIKGKVSTAGSKMMSGFVSPITASVVDKLVSAGISIESAPVSEFGISNPLTDKLPVNGGVQAVTCGSADAALCCDYNGAVRKVAAEAGICFIKPTYGTVSRFGLVSFAQSMEQIGVAAKNIEDCFSALSIIAGSDSKDGTCYNTGNYIYFSEKDNLSDLKIGTLEELDFPFFDVINQVSYIISCAEGSNNLSRFDGVKFGYRSEKCKNIDDLYVNTRSEGFEFDTKIAAIMGAYVLSKDQYEIYYVKATKIRRLIKDKIDELFKQYDCLILPEQYTALANLTGSPAASVSCPSGSYHIMAKHFNENVLLRAGKCLQRGIKL